MMQDYRTAQNNFLVNLCAGSSRIGGGAMPSGEIQSRLLCISPGKLSAPYMVKLLRSCNPPIIARLEKDHILLDVRTIQEKELKTMAQAIRELAAD